MPSNHVDWQFAFQKQWLWTLTWGRLLFDPHTPESAFAQAIGARYSLPANGTLATGLLDAWQQTGVVQLAIASFVYSTWDFTLHTEGFIQCVSNADKKAMHDGRCFISLEALIRQNRTLDPSLQTVSAFVRQPNRSLVSPLELAARVASNVSAAATFLHSAVPLNGSAFAALPSALRCEILDLWSWVSLGRYFAAKLQGAVELARHRADPHGGSGGHQARAVALLQEAQARWEELIGYTARHLRPEIELLDYKTYKGNPHGEVSNFSWADLLAEVKADVAVAQGG